METDDDSSSVLGSIDESDDQLDSNNITTTDHDQDDDDSHSEEEEEEESDKENKETNKQKQQQPQKPSKSQSSQQQPPKQQQSSQQAKQQSSSQQQQQSSQQLPDKKVQRLMITKLELENFKSYQGKIEIGPFHKSFSAVVGPNGSGKSNVIDAMLFVFGKKSSAIRLNKLTELIHNSEHHQNLPECRVSVYFQDIIDSVGEEEFQVVKGTDLKVTRVVKRSDGASRYYIDDRKSTFSEVTALLRKRGIDLDHNRFLILQGEVEQIAMMKPKGEKNGSDGLLEYLEDIIGSNKYVQPIEEACEQLNKDNAERSQILQRVKVSEREKSDLEEAKNEAEVYLKCQIELIEQKSILAQINKATAEKENLQYMEKRNKLEQKLKKEKEQMESSRLQLHEGQLKINSEQKLFDELEKQTAKLKNEHQAFEKKLIKYKEESKHAKTMLKKNEALEQEEIRRTEEYTKTIESTKKEIIKNEKEAAILPGQLQEEETKLDKMIQSLKGETLELQSEMEQKQKELMPWSKKFSEIKSKVDIQQSEIQVLSKDLNSSVHRLEDANRAIQDSKTTITKRTNEIQQSRLELDQLVKNQLPTLTTKLEEHKNQEEQLYRKSLFTRSKLEELKMSLSENTSRSRVLDRLIKMKERLPGIHGRLGDLGAIDKKYDVAISTAAPSLDNIVVDTTDTAEKCVQVLRDENLGRATFIILDKIDYLKGQIDRFKGVEGAPRLYDLIKMKDKQLYTTAFYYALRDTLVADNLEYATKIAYGATRYRVVTLDGSLIDTSGSMAGGGNRVLRGAMGSKIQSDPTEDRKELAKYQDQLQKEESELSTIRTNLAQLDSQLKQLQKRKSDLEMDLPKMEMDVKAAHLKLEEVSKAIPALEQQVKISSTKQQQIDKINESLKVDLKEYDKLKSSVDKLEHSIQSIQSKIINIGGNALKNQKQLVESLQQKIDNTQHNITKANVQIKSLEKSIDKSKKLIDKNNIELQENKLNIEKLKEKQIQLAKDSEVVREQFGEASNKASDKEEEITKLKQDLEALKKHVESARKLEVEIQDQLEQVNKIITEKQMEANRQAKKYDELNNKKLSFKIFEEDPDEPLEILTESKIQELMEIQDEIESKIAVLQEKSNNMKPNINAIKEYRKKDKEYQEKMKELDTITEQRDKTKKLYDDLKKSRLDEFMGGFTIITMKLKEMYQMITMGGDAELELVDSTDPFNEGISFGVRPPKKSWKNISNLSGGEKTLSSLALVFALHHYKPTPLYVMDEIDAALDFKNVSIVANYIKESTRDAQFIIISLRNYMFELADRLVGIYKTDNCTKSVTINPNSFINNNQSNNNNNNVN